MKPEDRRVTFVSDSVWLTHSKDWTGEGCLIWGDFKTRAVEGMVRIPAEVLLQLVVAAGDPAGKVRLGMLTAHVNAGRTDLFKHLKNLGFREKTPHDE